MSRAAWGWDVTPDLSLANKRLLLDKEDCDGMALDADGNIWITGFNSNGFIERVTPDGKLLPRVETPEGCVTQIRFGGQDMGDVYFNVVLAEAGNCLKEGKPLAGTSALYRGRSSVPGAHIGTAKFALSSDSRRDADVQLA